MIKLKLSSLVKIALVAVPAVALAQRLPLAPAACANDPLDVTSALQRLEWMRRCALTTNTSGPERWIDSLRAVDMEGRPARDYVELDRTRMFTGLGTDKQDKENEINYIFATLRYRAATQFVVERDDFGYLKWVGVALKKPTYPVYEITGKGGGTPLYPLPTLPGDCNLYRKNATTGVMSKWTGTFAVAAVCEAQ